jgi:hypothetical protein
MMWNVRELPQTTLTKYIRTFVESFWLLSSSAPCVLKESKKYLQVSKNYNFFLEVANDVFHNRAKISI